MPAPSQAPASNTNPNYREVERVRDPDGVVAVISERIKTGQMSFALYKEFDQDGKIRLSSYLGTRHIPAIRRVLDDLTDRLEQLEDKARSARRPRDAADD